MPAKYTEKVKTIKYESPSGRINIGKWVPPFKEVEGGYGFVGVLAEDYGTGQLQCHVCGQWHENLSIHVFFKHKLKAVEYAEKFGLFRMTALKSKRLREKQSKYLTEKRKENPKLMNRFGKKNKFAGNRKGKKFPTEMQNRYGNCEIQVV